MTQQVDFICFVAIPQPDEKLGGLEYSCGHTFFYHGYYGEFMEIANECEECAREHTEFSPGMIPGDTRYAVNRFQIETGIVGWEHSCGLYVDWGQGPNCVTLGYETREEAEAELSEKRATRNEQRKMGQKKWKSRHAGFVVRQGTVREVRLGEKGDLLYTSGGVASYSDAVWPKIFESRQAAEKALKRMVDNCHHSWKWISHEERRCNRCGEVDFVPDEY
jgi:hypothetical protein